jgi:HlyD family secretion protein
VSQIFDALLIAQDEALQHFTSLGDVQEERHHEPFTNWSRMDASADHARFTQGRVEPRGLPGRASLSPSTVRKYLLLGFVALVLVLVGTDSAVHAGGPWGNRKHLYGVMFEGTLRPANEMRITAEAMGTVAEIHVKVGDTVHPGQPLLKLNDRESELALEQAKMERDAARDNLQKFRARLADANARLAVAQREQQQVPTRQWRDSPERAQAVYDQALTSYKRAQELYDAGIIAQQELDARSTELRIARDDLENAKRLAGASANLERDQSEQANLEAKVTRQELQEQLHQAELKYEEAKQHLNATMVRATQAGVVAEIPVRLGDRVPAGTTLTRLAQLDRMIAEVPVAAQMVSQLHVGQSVAVVLPSNPPRETVGKIHVINPLPSPNMTHTVEVQFENPTLLLLVGQPAQIRFLKS